MKYIVTIVVCLLAVSSAVNNAGNLELKEAFDAAWIRLLANGSYDAMVYRDTGDYPDYYYGDCAVPTVANMDVTYPYVEPLVLSIGLL
jgi:hypothetical protein